MKSTGLLSILLLLDHKHQAHRVQMAPSVRANIHDDIESRRDLTLTVGNEANILIITHTGLMLFHRLLLYSSHSGEIKERDCP